jgi:glycosyltransferase involved in cell wall biosynthesis
VLHFIDSTDLRDGGVPRFVLDVARVMASQGHASTILTGNTTDTPAEWLANARDLVELGPINPRVPMVHHVKQQSTLSTALADDGMRDVVRAVRQADVVHLHCVWSIGNMQVADTCRAMGVPYAITCHGMLDDWSMAQGASKKRLYMKLGGKALLESAARVHCTAQGELDQSRKWFPSGAPGILTYIIDLEPYRTLPGPQRALSKFPALAAARERSEPIVLFLSRLHYKKGCDLLIKAAKQLHDAGTKACYVFAGTGDQAYVQGLKDLASSLGIADSVHFVGMVKGPDKVSIYEAADLFVLPTSQENFGLVLVEAMACGTPVMTTKGTDIWKDIEGSGAGIIVEQTAEAIAASLRELFASPSKLAQLAKPAREWVFANYDESVLIPKYVEFYRTIAQTTSPARRIKIARTPAMLWLLGQWNATPRSVE